MADWLELGYQRTLWAYNGLNSVCVFFFKSIYDICIDLIWDSFIWLLDQDSSDMCIYIYVQIYIYTWYIFTIYIYMPPICTYIVPSVSARQDLLDLPQRDLAEAAEAGS
jgi:hypothetical protein